MPLAVTVKETLLPCATVVFVGCDVMAGGANTVNVAAALVVLPTALVTVTE